ncbi:DNA mismatch repair protein MutS [Geomicrobium sp. JCM 19039]|uniref:DNA mismatch repair protein MutS n=1 Tax=Geomicrobium sp. JCM 19039 TaxID=1460636 RepID=UPI00045F49D4|nr:DNA mismatch repair protein MutS [Geomicrobium sp. JCM 19039]GAK10997.1 DNA mismatch repair protein MutS [Geomicrobium sp. JCM 19039]
MSKQTPMMQQYFRIKEEHEDAFLFFRLGDFYELFYDDAVLAARVLEITLTKRGKGDDAAPMCGVPYHSAESYITRLVEQGYKIAICEQTEDPATAKGVVKRDVVRVITPGTVMEGKAIQAEENQYILSLSIGIAQMGYARTDLSTGETEVGVTDRGDHEMHRLLHMDGLKEIVVDEAAGSLLPVVGMTMSIEMKEEIPSHMDHLYDGNEPLIRKAFGRLLNYLTHTQKRSLQHMQPAVTHIHQQHMQMDVHTRKNLEIIASLRERTKSGSLYGLLDFTKTAMGSRRLRKWIEQPLYNQSQIEARIQMVSVFLDNPIERRTLQEALQHVYDLERLAGKVAYGNVNARELVQLRKSLQQVPGIRALLTELGDAANEYGKNIEECAPLEVLLREAFVDEPPISIKEAGMIRAGYNEQLDTYREATENGKTWLSDLEKTERERTGIKTLKVGYNRVFGFYLEVSKGSAHLVPEQYERRQTLTNAERFATNELKAMESKILNAEDQMETLEYELFLQIREEVQTFIPNIQQAAKMISEIDVLQSFSVASEEKRFTKPLFSESGELRLERSRHPVVEETIPVGDYVPNDIHLDGERDMLLITGPNMAGKSTYMRQVAMISVMAQIGCYVPADLAVLPLFDRIFTRIGAADDLASGQSTFMVEMVETEYALQQASANSLVLLDEIGRGTSTYDGMALAQAIIEYIHEKNRCKTLFSTHYHELTILEEQLGRLKNVHVRAEEEDGNVIFLHKVEDGKADRSYGIHVAKLANLPNQVIDRAEHLLQELEQTELKPTPESKVHEQLVLFEETEPESTKKQDKADQRSKSEIEQEVQHLDVLHLSPIQALEKIYEWQRKINDSERG